MNHQPYETWLFSQEELEVEQLKELKVHLHLCEPCDALATALAEAEGQLCSGNLIAPAPGFTNRWRERIEQRKHVSQKRHTSLLFGAFSTGALILFLPLVVRWFLTALSPGDIVTRAMAEVVDWVAVFGFTSDVTTAVIDGMVDTIPMEWWFTLAFVLFSLISLWMVMMHRIQLRPQAEVID
jgi:hypothetical protein